MVKSFKVRIYSTKEQEQKIWKHIGACRFIWNYMIDAQQTVCETNKKYLSAFDMINLIKPLKNTDGYEWLKGVSNMSLCTTCRDLDKAYKGFFKGSYRHPRYKSKKRSKDSYPVRYSNFYFKDEHLLNVEKIGKIKYKTDFKFSYGINTCKFTNPRISYKPAKNIWMISFGMECENQTPELNDSPMGIDLGLKDLAIAAFEDDCIVFKNINKSQKVIRLEKEIDRLQRSIRRKYESSKRRTGERTKTKNIIKEEKKLRRVYARLNGIRQNHIHQATHKLVSMLPNKIVMEDLDITKMQKKSYHKKAKAIGDAKWGEFLRQIEYKSMFYGIEFVQANRYFPSSKTCSNCGSIKTDLTERDRIYICDECGLVIDRDYNAAINLMRYIVQS